MTQGVRVKRVGCFKEDPAKRSINTLLFSDLKSIRSTAKVDFKNFGRYTQGLISRCGAAAAAKSFLFFAINNIGKDTTERTLIFEIGCRFNLWDRNLDYDPPPKRPIQLIQDTKFLLHNRIYLSTMDYPGYVYTALLKQFSLSWKIWSENLFTLNRSIFWLRPRGVTNQLE